MTRVLSIINASVHRKEASRINYDLYILYDLRGSSDLFPRLRVKLGTGTSHFTTIMYITAHACHIIPPPYNSKSPSVTLSPRKVSAALFIFFFRRTSEVSAKRPNAMNRGKKTDDMGQCDKREKARRERRFVNGAAGESLLVAFSGISSCDGGQKGRDELDKSMAIPFEPEKLNVKAKVQMRRERQQRMDGLNK